MDQQIRRRSVNETRNLGTEQMTALPSPHPLGLGFGATGGGMAGAAIGSALGGPVGAAVGAMFGGLLGACGGHGIARVVTTDDILEAPEDPDSWDYDLGAQNVCTYADKEYARIREECERAQEDCTTLAIPWDQAHPFATRGWGRLSGVIGPRDTDRGLRGGI